MALLDLLNAAAHGDLPAPDGTVTVVADDPGRAWAVLGFTAHFIVCAPVEPDWVRGQLPPGDLTAPLGARFLVRLADRLGANIGAHDAVLVTLADGRAASLALHPVDEPQHPRVRRARRYRNDIQVWTTDDGHGVVLLGRGVAGRWEVAFEVTDAARGRGLGRQLAMAARGLLPAGMPIFAQVSPGNAASMRVVLAAGFRPVGAEVLLTPRSQRRDQGEMVAVEDRLATIHP